MENNTLQYNKTYSIDIIDCSDSSRKDNTILYFFMAELTYLKVPQGMTLVMIYPYDWNHLMTPWPYSGSHWGKGSSSEEERLRTGGGQAWAERFYEELIVPTEARLAAHYGRRFIGGYSLGGLMATFMATKLTCFDGLASCSGSFWYPGAIEFFQTTPFAPKVRYAYYSLGNKEALTTHPERSKVEANTNIIFQSAKLQGIESILEMNDGGHFTGVPQRIEKAMQYLLHK